MSSKEVSGEELCDYLTWAHFNAVPLQGDADRQKEYTQLVSETCPQTYYDKVTQAVQQVNQSSENLVASGFLTTLKDRVNLGVQPKGEVGANEAPLAFTNYQSLTSDILLTIASQALEGVKTDAQLPASSSLIFEIGADKTVRGYLNDVEYVPAGCSSNDACTAELFVSAIEAKIGYTDLETACATKATVNSDDLFIDQ